MPHIQKILATVALLALSVVSSQSQAAPPQQAAKTKAAAARPVPRQAPDIASLQRQEQEQLKAINTLTRANNRRIEAAFAKVSERPQMEAALRDIQKARSAKERNRRVAAYQKRYGKLYAQTLQRAGVQPAALLEQARRAAPAFAVTQLQGFSIKATPKRLLQPKARASEPPAPSSEVISITDFETTRSVTTGAGAGGSVELFEDGVESRALAVLVGGVDAKGHLKKRVQIPGDVDDAELQVKGKALVEALVVGVVGTSSATTTSGVSMDLVGSNTDRKIFGAVRSMIFAPFLWVTSDVQESSFDRRFRVRAGERWDLLGFAEAFVVAGLTPSSFARAHLEDVEATLVLER